MNTRQFDTLIKQLEPAQALSTMARAIKELLPLLGEEEQRRFVMDLFGDPGGDKVLSMVHL
jgi:hypothetical protein